MSKEIIVNTQAELDQIDVKADVNIYIHGGTVYNKIVVKHKYYWRVEAWGNSSVEAWENSSVVARGNSSVVARENSSVEAWGNSSVVAWGNSSVVAWGNVGVHLYSDFAVVTLFFLAVCWKKAQGKIIQKSDTAIVIEVPKFQATFEDYKNNFPVKLNGEVGTFFKAVHKYDDGTYHSDYRRAFTYEIGQVIEHECAPKDDGSCAPGIHIAFKSWARMFGRSWSDFAMLEVEVNIKDIVVSEDTDGKVRASKIKVVREVPRNEWTKNA